MDTGTCLLVYSEQTKLKHFSKTVGFSFIYTLLLYCFDSSLLIVDVMLICCFVLMVLCEVNARATLAMEAPLRLEILETIKQVRTSVIDDKSLIVQDCELRFELTTVFAVKYELEIVLLLEILLLSFVCPVSNCRIPMSYQSSII